MRRRLKETLHDPNLFVRRALKSDTWGKQEEILSAINKPHARVAVKACHASGKTFTAAAASLSFLAKFKEAIVITTAPTWNQVESIMWPEIRTMVIRSWYPFPKPLLTELNMGPKRFAMGYSTSVTKSNEGVKFQGFHAAHILIIIDEAPGVDPKIWHAIDGIRAGGDVRILALGNPIILGGPFEAAFKENRDTWVPITISAFDTPNFDGLGIDAMGGGVEKLLKMSEEELNDNPRPYLTTKAWVKEKYIEWGPGHPLYDSKVLGQFPTNSDVSLIQLQWIEQANINYQNKTASPSEDEDFTAGVDVAGPGDAETVLYVLKGSQTVLKKAWAKADPRGEVLNELRPFQETGRLKSVKVDSIGIGYNFGLHIADQEVNGLKYKVILVNVGEATDEPKRFVNKKAEYYWKMREKFQKGLILGPIDETTAAQLVAIRFSYDSKGRVEIESKEDMRKRGVKSPDHAEAYMLAHADIKIPWSGLMEFAKMEAHADA